MEQKQRSEQQDRRAASCHETLEFRLHVSNEQQGSVRKLTLRNDSRGVNRFTRIATISFADYRPYALQPVSHQRLCQNRELRLSRCQSGH